MENIVYFVKENQLTDDQIALFCSLQGIINSEKPTLLLDVDHYLKFIDSKKYKLKELSFDDCINKFLPKIDKYVLYTLSNTSTEINAAFSYCSATGALAVPHTLEYLVKDKLHLVEDLSALKLDNLNIQRYVFRKFIDKWNKDGLIHQPLQQTGKNLISIRDYAIPKKWFVCYCSENRKDRKFLDEVLSFLDKGIHLYGWTSDEISFVHQISKYGDTIIASDWSSNHSFFGTFEPKAIKRSRDKVKVLPNKHYVCLVVSDGDNIQWLERDFAFTSFFSEKDKVRRDYPLTFSISPALIDLAPKCLEYIYSQITNEDFVCGVSGYGYMNPCVFPKEYLSSFAETTNKYFPLCDIKVNTMLDNLKYAKKKNLEKTLSYFSKQDNIVGTLYQMDPVCYKGGKGRIFWSNDKPFISARESVWNTKVINDKPEHAPRELLKSIAKKINSLPAKEDSPEGYSYINVHPWSVHWWDIDELVDMFDDHIQVIDAEQFVELVRTKVKH